MARPAHAANVRPAVRTESPSRIDVSAMTLSELTLPPRRRRSAPVPSRMSIPVGVHQLGGTPHAGSGRSVYAAGSSTPSLARFTLSLELRTQ